MGIETGTKNSEKIAGCEIIFDPFSYRQEQFERALQRQKGYSTFEMRQAQRRSPSSNADTSQLSCVNQEEARQSLVTQYSEYIHNKPKTYWGPYVVEILPNGKMEHCMLFQISMIYQCA